MPRFDRVYSLLAGPGGGTGFEVTDSLRLEFQIYKTDDKNPNRSVIRVWNLSPDKRALVERKGTRCVLKVGYAQEGGPIEIYRGDVAFAWSKHEPPYVITTLELGEGAQAIRDSMVTLGYPRGVRSERAIRDVAAQMGLALHMPDDVPVREWQNGLSFHGPARTALDKIVAGTGLSWSIQNGMLQVIRAGGTTNRTVIELAADTGLLTAPERERKGATEAAIEVTDNQTGRKRRARKKKGANHGKRPNA